MSHFSFTSWGKIAELFKVIFGENDITANFTFGQNECSYINYGLVLYFKKLLKIKLKFSLYFVMLFDNSSNHIMQEEQADVRVYYFVQRRFCVYTRCLDSHFLTRPNGEQQNDVLSTRASLIDA